MHSVRCMFSTVSLVCKLSSLSWVKTLLSFPADSVKASNKSRAVLFLEFRISQLWSPQNTGGVEKTSWFGFNSYLSLNGVVMGVSVSM